MYVVIVETLITTKISCNSVWMAYMHTYIDCAFWTMCDFSDPFFLLLSQYWEQPLAPRFELNKGDEATLRHRQGHAT
jgi:hypothetical protein